MSDRPIRLQWVDFVRAVGLERASETQLREMQKAFYAGAKACFKIMQNISDAVPDTAAGIDIGTAMLELLNQDLNQFAAEQLRQSEGEDDARRSDRS